MKPGLGCGDVYFRVFGVDEQAGSPCHFLGGILIVGGFGLLTGADLDRARTSLSVEPILENQKMSISVSPGSIARKLLPILGWIPAYRRERLLLDVLSGVAVWAVMVPEGMAYSGIVGVPPIMGIYAIIPQLEHRRWVGAGHPLLLHHRHLHRTRAG